jgi:hypothetical protein
VVVGQQGLSRRSDVISYQSYTQQGFGPEGEGGVLGRQGGGGKWEVKGMYGWAPSSESEKKRKQQQQQQQQQSSSSGWGQEQ